MTQSLLISLKPDGDFLLTLSPGHSITISQTLEGMKILHNILAFPAGSIGSAGSPTQGQLKTYLQDIAKEDRLKREKEAEEFFQEIGVQP